MLRDKFCNGLYQLHRICWFIHSVNYFPCLRLIHCTHSLTHSLIHHDLMSLDFLLEVLATNLCQFGFILVLFLFPLSMPIKKRPVSLSLYLNKLFSSQCLCGQIHRFLPRTLVLWSVLAKYYLSFSSNYLILVFLDLPVSWNRSCNFTCAISSLVHCPLVKSFSWNWLFGMKLGDYRCLKVTEPGFWRKFILGQKGSDCRIL